MPTKLDLKKQYKPLYGPTLRQGIHTISVPKLQYLSIDGEGSPGGEAYKEALQALFPVAYRTKFYSKLELNQDYGVMPLQCLWWADDMTAFHTRAKDDWKWTAMILTPEHITKNIIETMKAEVKEKKGLARVDDLELVKLEEGECVQTLYVGPYDEETETIAAMHALIEEQGGTLRGKHHEIYLNSPDRVAPEKLKTIIRQPFTKK